MAQIPPFSAFCANKILRRAVFILFNEKLHPVILITFEISIKTSSRDVIQQVFFFFFLLRGQRICWPCCTQQQEDLINTKLPLFVKGPKIQEWIQPLLIRLWKPCTGRLNSTADDPLCSTVLNCSVGEPYSAPHIQGSHSVWTAACMPTP